MHAIVKEPIAAERARTHARTSVSTRCPRLNLCLFISLRVSEITQRKQRRQAAPKRENRSTEFFN